MNMSVDSGRTISAEQVAILAERVDTLLMHYSKLEGLIIGISNQQHALSGAVAVFQEKQLSIEANQRRLFQLADEQGAAIERLNSEVKVHSWTWRLVGTVAMVALGLVGWAFNELRTLYSQDSRLDNRTAILEFIVGGRQQPLPKLEGNKP